MPIRLIINTGTAFKVSKMLSKNIEINEQFKRALDIMDNTNKDVFVTGKAGTGKSTLLELFRETTRKKVAVLAPTGVAAVNIQGQTIHSFFGFKPDITPDKVRRIRYIGDPIYSALDAIVIDEISMVRADLLDCVDKFLRLSRGKNKPFGNVQMIFIGDLYQLPPVVTSRERELFRRYYKSQYFFDSKALGKFDMGFIELEKIYRQKDKNFIKLLNSIRNKSISEKGLKEINKRVFKNFKPKGGEFYISLTTTKILAESINQKELSKLKSIKFLYTGKITGKFEKSSLPTEIELNIKVGSQVMLLNNDTKGRWINGTIGKITGIEKIKGEDDIILLRTENGRNLEIRQYTWKMFNLKYNKSTGTIESETVGSFRQYPIKLAWAVTIHKGQGKTFSNAIIDIGHGAFVHGQAYVALSRCTSLDGIVLKKPIQKKHILMDWRIIKFLTNYQYKQSGKKIPTKKKIKIIEDAIKNKSRLSIIYLKSNDEKSKRIICPQKIGQMEYMNKRYLGVEAYCLLRKDDRVFRVDKILEMEKVE